MVIWLPSAFVSCQLLPCVVAGHERGEQREDNGYCFVFISLTHRSFYIYQNLKEPEECESSHQLESTCSSNECNQRSLQEKGHRSRSTIMKKYKGHREFYRGWINRRDEETSQTGVIL